MNTATNPNQIQESTTPTARHRRLRGAPRERNTTMDMHTPSSHQQSAFAARAHRMLRLATAGIALTVGCGVIPLVAHASSAGAATTADCWVPRSVGHTLAHQTFNNESIADAGLAEVGLTCGTGSGAPGECVMAVMRWAAKAGGAWDNTGRPDTLYSASGATSVSNPAQDATKGDIVQYVSNTNPGGWVTGVHTYVIVNNHHDGSYDIVQSNVPSGSGHVTSVTGARISPPSGFHAEVWRMGTPANLQDRIAVLAGNGQVVVKDGIYGQWVAEASPGSKTVALSGNRIAVLDNNGQVLVKDGIYGQWVAEASAGSKTVALSGNRIAVLDNNGQVLVKDGIYGQWVLEASPGSKTVALSGNRIAVLDNNGQVLVKDGIYGQWVAEASPGSKTVALSGNRIAVLAANGQVLVKDGIYGQWVLEASPGSKTVALSGNRIAVLDNNGQVLVKDGIYGQWVLEASPGSKTVALSGNRIAVLDNNGQVLVKDGIYGQWVQELATGSKTVALANT